MSNELGKGNKKLLMKGNEALAEAAVRAGCRCYFGYPITPQNEIPEYMSRRMPEVGGVFLQAESEIAAINMVFGASAMGARAMTSSSSPGISLKQEDIIPCRRRASGSDCKYPEGRPRTWEYICVSGRLFSGSEGEGGMVITGCLYMRLHLFRR